MPFIGKISITEKQLTLKLALIATIMLPFELRLRKIYGSWSYVTPLTLTIIVLRIK